jgi:hypothetical protein
MKTQSIIRQLVTRMRVGSTALLGSVVRFYRHPVWFYSLSDSLECVSRDWRMNSAMTKSFGFGMRARYRKSDYALSAVNFEENLFELRADHEAPEDAIWVRAEDAEVYLPNGS